jgi:hypothetical protein
VAGDAYQRYFTVAVPVGYQIEHSGVRSSRRHCFKLTEDPAGSGLAIGRALGRLDPANYQRLPANWTCGASNWNKDDRVSISVDSAGEHACTRTMWLYDAAGTQRCF